MSDDPILFFRTKQNKQISSLEKWKHRWGIAFNFFFYGNHGHHNPQTSRCRLLFYQYKRQEEEEEEEVNLPWKNATQHNNVRELNLPENNFEICAENFVRSGHFRI